MTNENKSPQTAVDDILTPTMAAITQQVPNLRSVLVCLDFTQESDKDNGTGMWYRLDAKASAQVAAFGTLDAALRCLPLLWQTIDDERKRLLEEAAGLQAKILDLEKRIAEIGTPQAE